MKFKLLCLLFLFDLINQSMCMEQTENNTEQEPVINIIKTPWASITAYDDALPFIGHVVAFQTDDSHYFAPKTLYSLDTDSQNKAVHCEIESSTADYVNHNPCVHSSSSIGYFEKKACLNCQLEDYVKKSTYKEPALKNNYAYVATLLIKWQDRARPVEEGFELYRLNPYGAPSMLCALIDSLIKGKIFYMRLATDEELEKIASVIEEGKAEFEGNFQLSRIKKSSIQEK